MDHLEKREWGRINVAQLLVLRSEKDPGKYYNALAIDVSEENIGFETEAKLSLGERIQLELKTEARTVKVQAIVERISNQIYGCRFTEDDYGKIFSFIGQKCLDNAKNAIKLLVLFFFHHKM